MLHRQALASRSVEPDLHFVLRTAVTLQEHLFGQHSREMDVGHDSRGTALSEVALWWEGAPAGIRATQPDVRVF